MHQDAPFSNLPHWRQLLPLSSGELAALDVAAVNLACATGLPGSDRIDAARCSRALDSWALGVGQVTEEALQSDFRRNPSVYDHSEPLFRMVTLVRALQVRCRVLYNPARVGVKPDDPYETDDQFVHGAIQGPGGTCASLPVVYAAVGRRLGYPVRLATAKSHVFCRWDDPAGGARVNVEGTSHDGVSTHPDDHYRSWPFPFDRREEAFFGYLLSLSPREELAHFLGDRGAVWESAGEFLPAIDAYAAAAAVDAPSRRYPLCVHRVVRRWSHRLREQGLIGRGFWASQSPAEPRRWPEMPWELEAAIRALEVADATGGRVSWGGPPVRPAPQ